MSDTPDLATPAQARELVGAAEYAAGILDGSLRRVQHEGRILVLGVDVDRLRRKCRPTWLARIIHPNERNSLWPS